MKTLVFGLLLLVSTATPSWAAGLQLSIRGGRVTLDAQDVTVRQILTEWARVGKTRIINLERITGGPITMKLEDVPERQALDTVLRAVPGYMAVPRQTLVADASIYDSIMVMATTTAVAAVRPPSAPGFSGGTNLTQLRPAPPPMPSPGVLPEPQDPTPEQEDAAIAAAAAAGLVPVPAPSPTPAAISAPLMAPAGSQTSPAQTPPGTVAPPANPWNAPAGTAVPTFTPPPQPTAPVNVPITRPRPPQPDR